MTNTKPKRSTVASPLITHEIGKPDQFSARAALAPSVNGATVMVAYQDNIMGKDVDLAELIEGLHATTKKVNEGDLSSLESMLVSQAMALQTMFTSLARRAVGQDQLKHYDNFMVLALKAQAQSRATISALVDLKYPRQATFIKQANVAHGPQQVNNLAGPGVSTPAPVKNAHAEDLKIKQPELLEADYGGSQMDRGTTSEAARSYSAMEALGSFNGAKNRRRKSQGSTQR